MTPSGRSWASVWMPNAQCIRPIAMIGRRSERSPERRLDRSASAIGSGLPLPRRPLAVLQHLAEGAAFAGGRVFDQAVDLASLVVLGQVFGDRQPLFVHEQEAVAVLVDL